MEIETNTRDFAFSRLVKPQTVLSRYCKTGSYYGIVPRKLPNRRLAWPVQNSIHLKDDKEGV